MAEPLADMLWKRLDEPELEKSTLIQREVLYCAPDLQVCYCKDSPTAEGDSGR